MDLLELAVVDRAATEPQFNIRNAIFALNDPFIEIAEPASAASPLHPFLEKYGDGVYQLCIQVEDLDATRAHVEALGVRVLRDLTFDDVYVGA